MSYRNLYADEVEAFSMQPGAVALDMRDYESYFAGHLQGAEHADEQCISDADPSTQTKATGFGLLLSWHFEPGFCTTGA